MKIQLIHLDDNPLTLSALKTSFLNYKHPAFDIIVDSFSLPDEFTFFINTLPDVNIFLLDIDLNHKHVDGTNIAEQCRAQFPNSVILMMSAFDNNFNIEKSRQCGADDFLTKNIIDTALPDLIISTYERIIFSRGQSETSHTFPKPYSELPKFAGTTIKAITLKIAMAIRSAASSIYIEGETGTGKEIVAKIVAAYLPPNIPFISINCAEFQETLLESELFGHVKGSFTGAAKDKIGILESANGGWIFLDEINRLSVSAQQKLMRAIEAKEIRRVGDNTSKKINFKIVSASNQSVTDLLSSGKMELDFWTRISDIKLYLPPLRSRSKKEVSEIIQHISSSLEGGPYTLYPLTLRRLENLAWGNGNVRDIRRALTEMTASHSNKVLLLSSIPEWVYHQNQLVETPQAELVFTQNTFIGFNLNLDSPPSFDTFIQVTLSELVKQIKSHALKKGVKVSDRMISEMLQLSRPTLHKYLSMPSTPLDSIRPAREVESKKQPITSNVSYHDLQEVLHNFSVFINHFSDFNSLENTDRQDIAKSLNKSLSTLSSFINSIH